MRDGREDKEEEESMGYISAGVDVESAVMLALAALGAGVVIFVRRHWRERRSEEKRTQMSVQSQMK